MESKKFYLKIFISCLFASAVLAAFAYVCIRGDIEHNILSFSCIGACFLFSLLFLQLSPKKIVFSTALAVNVVADAFLTLLPSARNNLIGVCVLCAVQVIYFVYTLFLLKGNGLRVISLAVRVGICLLAYFLLPKYFALTTIQILYAIIATNSFLTLLAVLFKFDKEWDVFFAFLLLFAFDFFSALGAGWAVILKFPLEFMQILATPFLAVPGLAYLFHIPAVLLLALSSAWAKTKSESKVLKEPAEQKTDLPDEHGEQNSVKQNASAQGKDTISRPTQTEGISTVSLDDL